MCTFSVPATIIGLTSQYTDEIEADDAQTVTAGERLRMFQTAGDVSDAYSPQFIHLD
jgi:hypothetical protein